LAKGKYCAAEVFMENDQIESSGERLIELIDELMSLPALTKSRIEEILRLELKFHKQANPYIAIYAAEPNEGIFSNIEYKVPRRGCTTNARWLSLFLRHNVEISCDAISSHYGYGLPDGVTPTRGEYGTFDTTYEAPGKALWFTFENKAPDFHLVEVALRNEDPAEADPDTTEHPRWWQFW
jgi:hypothetical protein